MKLYELISVITSDFVVGVNNGTEHIEEFGSNDTSKRTKYRNALVTSVYVLNEDTITINVDITQ